METAGNTVSEIVPLPDAVVVDSHREFLRHEM